MSYRYSREQLMDIHKSLEGSGSGSGSGDVSSLYAAGWHPGQANGSAARGWGKPSDGPVPQDPDVCWDAAGSVRPMWLQAMSEEEKEVSRDEVDTCYDSIANADQLFSSDINSPIKPPLQNKDGGHQGTGVNGRKASLSHGSSHGYGLSSPPSATRPGPRRRETTDTNPFPSGGLASPTAGRYSAREDQGYWLGRKSSDTKEPAEDAEEESVPREPKGPGFLMRSSTSGSAGFGSSSLWGSGGGGPPSATAGGFGNFALPSAGGSTDKKYGSTRGESRLAHLIPKESTENVGSRIGDGGNADLTRSWRSRPRTDTDPFGDDVSGSPPSMATSLQRGQGFDALTGSTGDLGMSGLSMGGESSLENGGFSPSGTNPYRSPPAEHGELEHEEQGDTVSAAFGGGPLARNFGAGGAALDGSDRSQTSSVGPKAYPSLGSLGGWPAGSSGTPDRERSAFGPAVGGSMFNPVSEVHSPGLSSFGGVFGPGSSGLPSAGGVGGVGRSSKLGSLFPPAMQAQMQEQELMHDATSDHARQSNPLGAIGAIGGHAGRGIYDDVFPTTEASRSPALSLTTDALHLGGMSSNMPAGFGAISAGPSFSTLAATAVDPSLAGRLEMVMPDRMRWVYMDPQGKVQGPFTGLEMNDWYKGNFFTADLRVKRLEDGEFEPLGQLIRRIGNSREPFLVPQVGIPHGIPSQTGPFSPSGAGGVIQPPLPGALPTYGRTLTADEQNNLERRKQEEQMMMARQREFVQQQNVPKYPAGTMPGLQHQTSQHSLHSQPSFGSITSPMAMAPPPHQLPLGAAYFGEAIGKPGATQSQGMANPAAAGLFREDDLAQLSGSERGVLASMASSQSMGFFQPQQPSLISPPAVDLRSQLPGMDQLQDDDEGFKAKLQEFNYLREGLETATAADKAPFGPEQAALGAPPPALTAAAEFMSTRSIRTEAEARKAAEAPAASAHRTQPMSTSQVKLDAWAKPAATSGLPMPFPAPPPSRVEQQQPGTPETATSAASQPPPLAPWARETGVESHKGPSLKEIQEAEARKAARADEAAAAARRAALEHEAATMRERERAAASNTGLATTSTWGSGSPVTAAPPSAWAKPGAGNAKGGGSAGGVPAAPAGASGGAMAAPGAQAAGGKSRTKTLADIQREEELRKQKALQAQQLALQQQAAAGMSASLGVGAGKRYADLASRSGAQQAGVGAVSGGATGAGGWATVGAGGKVKVPTGPATAGSQQPQQSRAVSTGSMRNAAQAAAAVATSSRPALPKGAVGNVAAAAAVAGNTGGGKPDTGKAAVDEFHKWTRRELVRGVSAGVDGEFVKRCRIDVSQKGRPS